ncbi:MAG: signal peptidase I [Cellulomonas sp. 14-74-6]|nr:MAG: signal peptidase I [Cellulomonas sp. 14-74-6]
MLLVVRSALGWLLLSAGLWLVWPSTLGGCTTLTVISGHSMEPTYYTGDLVVARCGTPTVGDVAVYRPSAVSRSARIIHRVVGGDATVGFQMKGDNNTFLDPFTPRQADVVGVAVLRIPQVGRVSALVFNPWVWVGVLLAAAVLLIWPSDGTSGSPEAELEADVEPAEQPDAELPVPAGSPR